MSDPFNLPEAEFDAVMTEIDEKLRQKSDRVPGREILGLAEYCAKFQVTLANNHPTTKRIINWFSQMYGDRLGMDWDFGRTVVLSRGELYKIRGVRFFGTFLMICDPSVLGKKLKQQTPNGIIDVFNLLERVQGLTPDAAARVPVDQCPAMLKAYARMYLAFSRLEAAQGARLGKGDAPFVKEAVHDLITSVESLLTSPPNYGQSKWSSLQAVEKLVKSCIREKGTIPKKSHDLYKLFATAEAVGTPSIDKNLTAKIECSADVRYDSSLVSRIEAVDAHYAALSVCQILAPTIKRTDARSELFEYEFELPDRTILKGIMLGYAPPALPKR
jgi:HEPN domain-containing protein